MRLATSLLVGASLAVVTNSAQAQAAGCNGHTLKWAARCAVRIGVDVRPSLCTPQHLVVSLALADGDTLDVQITHVDSHSFLRAGEFGLSPIGQFADWSQESAARRDALAGLADCTQIAGGPGGLRPGAARASRRSSSSWPWRLFLGLLLLAGVIVAGRRTARASDTVKQASVFVGLAVVAWLFRWLALPRAFFHQNGQGPLWVDYALGNELGLSHYGPGYRELYGTIARWAGAEADVTLFFTQSLVGALTVPLIFVVARAMGARLWLAFAVGIVVALDPLLGRAMQSESYLAACLVLQFLAAASLALVANVRVRSLYFAAGLSAAGLFVSQAARVHPLSWVPCALLPVILLLPDAPWRARLARTLAAGFGVGAIVLATSADTLRQVLGGSLGQQWMPGVGEALLAPNFGLLFALALVIAVLTWWLAWPDRAAIALALIVFAATVAYVTNLVAYDNPWISALYWRQFVPVFLAALAAFVSAVLARPKAQRMAAIGVAVAGLSFAVFRFGSHTHLPTDAQEANWALTWRKTLPKAASVVYVQRAERRVFVLPLYRLDVPGSVNPLALVDEQTPTGNPAPGAPSYYYQSSLCSTPEGKPICQRVESKLILELVAERTFPAVPSLASLPLDSANVTARLYRITNDPRR